MNPEKMSVLSQYSQLHNEAMAEQWEVLSGTFSKLGSVSVVPKEIDRPSKGLWSTVPRSRVTVRLPI